MTAVFATATVATGAMGMEIVQYEPVSKIGGGTMVFGATPPPVETITNYLIDDEGATIIDDESIVILDDGE